MMSSRKYKRVRIAAAAIVALALISAGCGGDDEGNVSGADGSTASAGDGGTPGEGEGAGIESTPRDVAGMFQIDDGSALFDSRPDDEDRTGVTDDAITLGLHLPLTGPLSAINNADAMRAMAAAVNEAGGIHGRELRLIIEDSAGSPAGATSAVQKLVEQDQVFAMFGSQLTAPVLATAAYLESQGIPEIAPNAHSVLLYQPPPERRWAFGATIELIALTVADVLYIDHPEAKVSVIYQNDDSGNAGLAAIRNAAGEHDGEIINEVSFDPAASADLTSQVRQALQGDPDALFIEAHLPFAQPMMSLLRDTLDSDVPVYFGGTQALSVITDSAPQFEGATGARFTIGVFDDDPRAERAEAFFKGAGVDYNSPTFLTTVQFEFLTRALELAGPDLTREGLNEALETGFTGDWTCWVCFAPAFLGPDDHMSVETAVAVRWSEEDGGLVQHGEPISYESSKGEGISDRCPECLG